MTVQQSRTRADRHGAPTEYIPRLLLKPKARKTGYVDGAWWPRDTELTTELPALLAALSYRLSPVDRVVYHPDQWSKTPAELLTIEGAVQLDGYRSQPIDTLTVLGVAGHRLVLLVVAPYTDPHDAYGTMMTAACLDDISTVAEPYRTNPANLAETAAAEQHWNFAGAAVIGQSMDRRARSSARSGSSQP